jgi:Autotransporter beta-domain
MRCDLAVKQAEAVARPAVRSEGPVGDPNDCCFGLLGDLKRRATPASFAVCGFAFLFLGVPNTAHAQSANVNCSNPSALAGLVSPKFTWTLQAACSSLSTATGATTAVTTIDIAFLTQSTAFVSTPGNPQPNQMGGGLWIRGVGGQNTISSTGTATTPFAPGTSLAANSQSRMDFGGFQVGADVGRFNLGASGLNIIVGLTGGMLDATDHELTGSGTFGFEIPFVGGYAAATWGNFFADVLVREDFYSEQVTAAPFGLSNAGVGGNAINVTGSAGYRFDVGRWFVEPSVGIVWSRLDLNALNVPGVPGSGAGSVNVPPGTYTIDPVNSLIGRAGVRVGTSVQAGDFGLQPFVAASVWNEFASNVTSTFTTTACPCGPGTVPLNIDTTRIGTFGQFGVGTAVQILNTGWLGFVRVDYRTGEFIQGWDVAGGVRYQFAWGVPVAAPIVTK